MQNINLLKEVNVQPVTFFNSRLIIKVSLAWLLLLFSIYIVGVFVGLEKQRKVNQLKNIKTELIKKISPYDAGISGRKLNIDLRDIHLGVVRQKGFYHYFKKLSGLVPSGVWLTKIILEPDDVTIQGGAVTAFGVSSLLENLNSAEGFRDKQIRIFDLEKSPGSDDKQFKIGTFNELEEQEKE